MRMGENTKAIGDIGEDMACEYLKNEGYIILERQFKTDFAEIDIIAQKDDVVAIVEVKSATSPTDFNPSEKVNKQKQGKIKRAAIVFTWQHGENWCYRFDVIEIVGEEIFHIEDAFQ